MAIIQCPECGKEISDKAKICIHCGCPIEIMQTKACPECGAEIPSQAETCPYCGCPLTKTSISTGSVVIQASGTFIGVLGRYIINDENGNTLASLKAGETYQAQIVFDTTYYIRLKGGFGGFQKVIAYAEKENKFYVDSNFGALSIT